MISSSVTDSVLSASLFLAGAAAYHSDNMKISVNHLINSVIERTSPVSFLAVIDRQTTDIKPAFLLLHMRKGITAATSHHLSKNGSIKQRAISQVYQRTQEGSGCIADLLLSPQAGKRVAGD